MKLKHLAVLSLTVSAAFGTGAMAADATVTFKGRVLGSTCIPDIGGAHDATVTLDPITQSMFPAVNSTAGEKSFTINLTSCADAPGTKVKAYFWQAGAQNQRVSVGSGTGAGWSYQLLPASGDTPLQVGNNGSSFIESSEDAGTTPVSGAGTLTYRVRYYREQPLVTNGNFDATANYVLYTN